MTATRFTFEAATTGIQFRDRVPMIGRALRTAQWKPDGMVTFLGVVGWNPEIYEAAQQAAESINRYADCYDTFKDVESSVIRGDRIRPVPHIRTPPSLHPRARIYTEWPDFSDVMTPANFICFSAGYTEPVMTLRRELMDYAVLVGQHAVLRELSKRRRLRYMVLCHSGDWIAVRVDVG